MMPAFNHRKTIPSSNHGRQIEEVEVAVSSARVSSRPSWFGPPPGRRCEGKPPAQRRILPGSSRWPAVSAAVCARSDPTLSVSRLACPRPGAEPC